MDKIIKPDGSKTINQYAGDTLFAVKQLVDHHPITNLPQWRTRQYLYNNNRLTELLESHAERVILNNIPKDATVTKWGILRASKQKNEPCDNCKPFVEGY